MLVFYDVKDYIPYLYSIYKGLVFIIIKKKNFKLRTRLSYKISWNFRMILFVFLHRK